MARGNWTGTTITFGTSGFAAQILGEIAWDGIDRVAIETTHFSSTQAGARQVGGRTFIPGKLVDPGTLTIEIAYDPTLDLPIAAADVEEVITVQPPSGISSNPITLSGFMQSASIGAPLEGYATARVVIKLTGLATTPTT